RTSKDMESCVVQVPGQLKVRAPENPDAKCGIVGASFDQQTCEQNSPFRSCSMLDIKKWLSNRAVCRDYPTTVEIPDGLPEKFDLDISFVDHDLAEMAGRKEDATLGPDLIES